MKQISLLKKLSFAALLSTSLLFIGCDVDDDDVFDDNMYNVSGNASGSQEVPAVTTSATGTFVGSYNANTNVLNYNINWTGLSNVASMAHIHGPAVAGASAGPIHSLSITSNGVNGTLSGSVTLADSTETHLLNGRLYYNIHTALYPNGEIRGQLTASAQ